MVSVADYTNLMREEAERLVDWKQKEYDTEINNLNDIKNSLDDVNSRRERELNLIKAQQALENAQNEKKHVYREGIGWTYEADSNAIVEAQENLQKAQQEIDKNNIQYQIDSLQT